MIRLLKIDLAKIKSYRTFWVLIGIYFAILALIPISGMEVLKWLASKGADLGEFDIMKIPLYHFPDIWQNLTYISKFITVIAGILMIILITNEYSFKTIRQNVIDGMNRGEFIGSKVIFIFSLSFVSTVFIMLIGLVMGTIYSPESELAFMFKHFEFVPAFFLYSVNFLLFSLVIGLVIKRAGLSIVILLIYPLLETIFVTVLPNFLESVGNYLPFGAISNLIDFPFSKYAMQEIRDSVDWKDVFINIAYIPVLIGIGYQTIANKNLS